MSRQTCRSIRQGPCHKVDGTCRTEGGKSASVGGSCAWRRGERV